MKVPQSTGSKWNSLWTVGLQALAINHSSSPGKPTFLYKPSFINALCPQYGSCFLACGTGLCGIRLPGLRREWAPVRTRVWRGGRIGLVVLHSCGHCVCGCHGCLCRVEVGFFLKLADILLVPDSFVAKPVGYLQITRSWVRRREVRVGRSQTSRNYGTPRGSLGRHSYNRALWTMQNGFGSPLSPLANLSTLLEGYCFWS